DPKEKAQWFPKAEKFDFRVDGCERNIGGPPGGPVFTMDARYLEIVLDQRIVYSYTMDKDETRISISITTVEFKSAEKGTQMIFTEQGAFLDGHDLPEDRFHGTKLLLDKLGEHLQKKSTVEK